MKKAYIQPRNTVVKLNLEVMIAQSIDTVDTTSIPGFGGKGDDTGSGGITEADSREIIRSRDAWEEW